MISYCIKVEDARPGMKVAEPAYFTTSAGTQMLAARIGAEIDQNLIKLMTARGVKTIEVFSDVPLDDIAITPPEPLKASTPNPPPNLPPEKIKPIAPVISEKLKEEAVCSVKELFDCFSDKDNVNKTTAYKCVSDVEGVIDDLIEVLTTDNSSLIHINDLKSVDDYTYHHSISVAVLAMATGRELGFDKNTLFRLGRCAMMHDIGKQAVPIGIINKKGKLTDEEYDTIKQHVIWGVAALKANGVGDQELWDGIMYHHEKTNGTGYPDKLKSDQIPLFSKIISVADVYDAITSFRSYRNPMLPSEAFNIIFKEVGISFEYPVVKAFFAKLELYPLNTIVELSDGRLAIIHDSDTKFRLRPAVRLWGSDEIIYLAATANRDLNIINVMHANDLPPGYEAE
ncbi:MAG: HD-GYP domain-containing protein [Defluviitaleaceae bacterium]|nr:HD-GYP domain-containing protein [Defluviitaleaceae bacterium]